jgi:hypothetical protein
MTQSPFATKRENDRFAGCAGMDRLFTVIIILIGRAPPVLRDGRRRVSECQALRKRCHSSSIAVELVGVVVLV